ncbi:hypothetical protein HKX48_001929 [Thoreauomyces humboldtii]|nr:hypothetical protein HKX48_001929 [Thoreauomyces humboldtii]
MHIRRRLPLQQAVSLSVDHFLDEFAVFKPESPADTSALRLKDPTPQSVYAGKAGSYMGFRKQNGEDYYIATYVGKSSNLKVKVNDSKHQNMKGKSIILVFGNEHPAGYEELLLSAYEFRDNLNSTHGYTKGGHARMHPESSSLGDTSRASSTRSM